MPTAGYLSLLIVWSIAAGVGLGASLIVTNPLTIGPIGVTGWFLILFLELASVSTLALYGVKTYLHRHATGAARLRYSWRQGLLISGWIVGLLALSSLGQLGLKDVILLGLLLVIIEVYVRFRRP